MEEQLDNMYIKYLNGDLSAEELEQLNASGDLAVMDKIMSETDSWRLPAPTTTFTEFKENKILKKDATPVRTLEAPKQKRSSMRMAASIVILLGLASFAYLRFFNVSTFTTTAGESMAIQLPDGSHVTLNGNSSLSYNNWYWEDGREVEMSGQALFEVTKKGPFHVAFDKGSVDVLGTQFEILSYGSSKSVKCFEGKVRVSMSAEVSYELTAGMGVREVAGGNEEFTVSGGKSTWMDKYTKFEETPLTEVLDALSLRFGLEWKVGSQVNQTEKFNGQFPNKDEELALEMVFESMGIGYHKKDNEVVLD